MDKETASIALVLVTVLALFAAVILSMSLCAAANRSLMIFSKAVTSGFEAQIVGCDGA